MATTIALWIIAVALTVLALRTSLKVSVGSDVDEEEDSDTDDDCESPCLSDVRRVVNVPRGAREEGQTQALNALLDEGWKIFDRSAFGGDTTYFLTPPDCAPAKPSLPGVDA